MSVISRLLSQLGVAAETGGERNDEAAPPAVDLEALRRRMMPADDPSTATQPGQRVRSYVLPLRRSGPSYASVPWQQMYAVDGEWKPVVLSDLEMSIPAVPSLDELAEEGGIKPDEPRFPFDE